MQVSIIRGYPVFLTWGGSPILPDPGPPRPRYNEISKGYIVIIDIGSLKFAGLRPRETAAPELPGSAGRPRAELRRAVIDIAARSVIQYRHG